MLLFKGIRQPVDDALIEIVASQLRVAVGGFHIEDAIGNAQQRHVKSATTEVEHEGTTHRAAVEAVRQRCSSGLIENPLHRDSGKASGIAGGLALSIVEVSRNGDHSRFHRFAQIGAGVIHQFADDAGHQFFRGVFPLRGGTGHAHLTAIVGTNRVRNGQTAVLEFVPVPADEAFEVGKSVAWAEHQLTPCQLPHHQFLILAVTDHGWCGAATLGVGDHMGTACLKHCHH